MRTSDVTAIITAMTDSERPFLAECVASVLSDTGIARAIVCVQDSNTWIEEVRDSVQAGDRLLILRMSLSAVGCVRNEAVKHVDTEWIAFCDGDDVWCKGKTAIQRTHALEHNADFVASDHYLTNEAGRVCAVALAKYLPMTSAWMVRTSVMQQYRFKEEDKFNGLEDHEWWFATKKTVKKERCPNLLLRYRVRGVSLSNGEPSKARKVRVVALASKPLIGWGVLVLTACMWLFNRSRSYRPLLK
jgi:glycosyltransferase involved in cell wall biosynthesis